MHRDNWFGTAIFVFVVVFIVLGTIYIPWPDFQHKQEVERIGRSASVLDLSLKMQYDKPPIYVEQYTVHNDNGVSTVQYKIQGYSGKVVTITLPPDKTYMVTFFFERVVQDGAWKITNKPPVGNTNVHYTLHIHQVADLEQGSRTVTFTDPHYWALQAGREYQIELSKSSPVPDLTKLQSTTLADPRYEKIVQEFRDFGPPEFRQKVAQAQALVRASK
ncbi:MAG TPA: hypothetical protein VKT72_01150 [Candidatus Baltobacteraceae bacterium]|nr:hypothetical protein [Candidatus Baltobacteraceae bacterium]